MQNHDKLILFDNFRGRNDWHVECRCRSMHKQDQVVPIVRAPQPRIRWAPTLPSHSRDIPRSTFEDVCLVLLYKDASSKLSSTGHIDFLKDRFEMVLHGVQGDV